MSRQRLFVGFFFQFRLRAIGLTHSVFWRGRVVADDDNNTPRCCIYTCSYYTSHTLAPDSDDNERSIFFRRSESFESNIYNNMSLYLNRTALQLSRPCESAGFPMRVHRREKKIIYNIITCSSRCHTTNDVAAAIYYMGI